MADGRHEHLLTWGGANDGKIQYPISWDTLFIIDSAQQLATQGEVYISAPTLVQ